MKSKILQELSELASIHKLVPFIGAGCSYGHLNLDWNQIRDDLEESVKTSSMDHLIVAQEFVIKNGKEKLCEYLEKKLLIDSFDDEKGFNHLAVMALNLGIIYTTNQDNIMEKCFEKYGRNYTKIIELEDLGKSLPGNNLYIKFHGDLSKCSSVIFSLKDYENRIEDETNFLNIRLKSDLLAKNLLFIGYSLRDKNIHLILKELQNVFGKSLPPSYMIAWEYSSELEELCSSYGVNLIDPLKTFPESSDNIEAFVNFLTELVNQTFYLKSEQEVRDLFNSLVPYTSRVISKYEINAIRNVIDSSEFSKGCNIFRHNLDQTFIPLDFEKEVVILFKILANKCSNSKEFEELNNASFNLLLNNKKLRLEVLIYLMASSNMKHEDIIPPLLQVKGILQNDYYIAIPNAVEIALKRGPITNSLRRCIGFCIENADLISLEPDEFNYIKQGVDKAWKGTTTLENPITKKMRMDEVKFKPLTRSPEDISISMLDRLPKRISKPFEE